MLLRFTSSSFVELRQLPAGKLDAAVYERETTSRGLTTTPSARPLNTLTVIVEGIFVEALLHTGANIFVVSSDLCARLQKVKTPYSGPLLCGVNRTLTQPVASCTARVVIGEGRLHIEFTVLSVCAREYICG